MQAKLLLASGFGWGFACKQAHTGLSLFLIGRRPGNRPAVIRHLGGGAGVGVRDPGSPLYCGRDDGVAPGRRWVPTFSSAIGGADLAFCFSLDAGGNRQGLTPAAICSNGDCPTSVGRRGCGQPTAGGEPSRRSGVSSAPSPRGLGSYRRKGLWRHVNKVGLRLLAALVSILTRVT